MSEVREESGRIVAIPECALVVLVGASGSGKSTFAARHFRPTEILSSDMCRAWVCDDPNSQDATAAAFDVLHLIAAKRLETGRLTVIDATNVQTEARRPLVAVARRFHCMAAAIVLDVPENVCRERNAARTDRRLGPHVVRQQRAQLRGSLRGLEREGFRYVYVLRDPAEVDRVTVRRDPLWTDRRGESGPFDIVGDVHGCYDELVELLVRLGYVEEEPFLFRPPEGRKLVLLGDLVDRGPRVPDVVRLAMRMVETGRALCVPGNHDVKFVRRVNGRDVRLTHGLAATVEQFERAEQEQPGVTAAAARFLDGLVSHFVLDHGRLVVAHAGMKAEMQGRASGAVREFALYGETSGETDEYGLPVRHNWALEYRGRARVVYGHTPVPHAEWLNNTLNVDTGCVFGGRLTALRYPELEVVDVAARACYATSARPFLAEPTAAAAPGLCAQHLEDELLDLGDLQGKRIVQTRWAREILVRPDQMAVAIESMSRFGIHPKWLIHLPPTMSPCATPADGEVLEHPREAFAEFRAQGVDKVVCEIKHMGSRAIAVVCRDEGVARERFGLADTSEGAGVVFTRSGRRFFSDRAMERDLLDRIRNALSGSGLWEEWGTDWVCLDGELMPWSVKAEDLVRTQFAEPGAAGAAAFEALNEVLRQAATRCDVEELQQRAAEGATALDRFRAVVRGYCWEVQTASDLQFAPFHVLAMEGRVCADRGHAWHLDAGQRLAQADATGLLRETEHRWATTTDAQAIDRVSAWWEERTAAGAEGMVVKPADFFVKGPRGWAQPALKVRGRDYLRIIYGPEYLRPEHLTRLKARRLGGKRSLALREFALGMEALERFVRREPLYRVHECILAVLALEAEPLDPRL